MRMIALIFSVSCVLFFAGATAWSSAAQGKPAGTPIGADPSKSIEFVYVLDPRCPDTEETDEKLETFLARHKDSIGRVRFHILTPITSIGRNFTNPYLHPVTIGMEPATAWGITETPAFVFRVGGRIFVRSGLDSDLEQMWDQVRKAATHE